MTSQPATPRLLRHDHRLAFGDDRGLRRWLRGVIAGDGRAAEPGGTTSGGAGGNPDLFSGVVGTGVFGGL
jgi:hypothetical protein